MVPFPKLHHFWFLIDPTVTNYSSISWPKKVVIIKYFKKSCCKTHGTDDEIQTPPMEQFGPIGSVHNTAHTGTGHTHRCHITICVKHAVKSFTVTRLHQNNTNKKSPVDSQCMSKLEITTHYFFSLYSNLLTCFNTLLIPFGKFGPPYLGGATAAARAALPSPTSALRVLSCSRNTPNSDMDCRIVNMRTSSLLCVRIHKKKHWVFPSQKCCVDSFSVYAHITFLLRMIMSHVKDPVVHVRVW